jgi:hypothetical protein
MQQASTDIGTIRSEGSGFLAIDFDGVAATTGGAVCSILNPFGADVFIVRSWLLFRTQSTGSANVNVGIGAAATTDASDMISALAAGGTTGKLYNAATLQGTTKTEVSAPALWSSTKYLNVTGASSTVGMEATLFIETIPAT